MTDEKPESEEPKKDPPEGFEFPSLHSESSPPDYSGEASPDTGGQDAPSPAEELKGPGVSLLDQGKVWFNQHKATGLIIAFVTVGLVMYGISIIRRPKIDDPDTAANSAPDVIPVNAVEVRMGRFQDEIDNSGNIKGEAEIELRFEVDGTIQAFDAAEGAKIHKGQTIARLNDRDAKLKVERAKIELEQKTKLLELGGISKTSWSEARLNMDVAQSELDKTRIVATRDGILGDKSADVGEFVTPQRKIATVVSIKNVVVKVGIIEKLVDKVYPGQKILVTVDAYPGNVFEGTIADISPIIIGESRTFEATAKIPNPDNLLLPGMFARTRIITYEADDAISVPNNALVKTAGGFQVFVVGQDNVAAAKDVEVGYVATEYTQIRTGLNAGEVVIVQKPTELKAGSKVKIIEVQKPGA